MVPTSQKYAEYNASFNKRKQLSPQVRVVAGSAASVQAALAWAVKNSVPFAARAGGHSYEGTSQSTGLVIDVRGLQNFKISDGVAKLGAGQALGHIYETLSKQNLVIPAGSCFHVGAAGHTLGGGYGLLARPFGLACDALKSAEIVTADGRVRTVSLQNEPDLFWALRGGGNGNFGIVTQLNYRTHQISRVSTFGISWTLPIERAIKVMRGWQDWIATLNSNITPLLHIQKDSSGQISLRGVGQSIGTETELLAALATLENLAGRADKKSTKTAPFIDTARRFNGKDTGYLSILMKAKSDYMTQAMSDEGMRTLFTGLSHLTPGAIAVICDTYGGAINKKKVDETAFVHRGNTQYSMQYYSQWAAPKDSIARLKAMRGLHDSMRPFVSGGAYINYCDLDIKDYQTAYWGSNLAKLKQLKAKYDPQNIFKGTQGIKAN